MLNICRVARDQRRFNIRHNAVLKDIAAVIEEAHPSTYHLISDTGSYDFPHHIVPTDLRPDLVWWNDTEKVIYFAELTIPFETSFVAAAERKSVKYDSLVSRAMEAGYSATFIPIQERHCGSTIAYRPTKTGYDPKPQFLSHVTKNSVVSY